MQLPYTLDPDDPFAPPIGLIVLQSDETIELEFRHYFAQTPSPVYVSRIFSHPLVSPENLGEMAQNLTASARFLPQVRPYAVVGYACTSGAAVIGSDRVTASIQSGCTTQNVTNPLDAVVAQCRAKGISRMALLSPYVESVNFSLIEAFTKRGLALVSVATFDEAKEERVARISRQSLLQAVVQLSANPEVEGVFMSCTNLKTMGILDIAAKQIGKPVLSSNQALAWHMQALSSASL